jgi:hypothetical protein
MNFFPKFTNALAYYVSVLLITLSTPPWLQGAYLQKDRVREGHCFGLLVGSLELDLDFLTLYAKTYLALRFLNEGKTFLSF